MTVSVSPDLSRRRAALLAFAGVVVTLIGVAIAVACGAPPDLADSGDDAARAIADAPAFRVGIVGWFVAIVGDVVRAWALFVFFRDVNKSLAMLGAWWMLLHDAVFGAGLAALLGAADVVAHGAVGVGAAGGSAELLRTLLHIHSSAFHIGLLFFSLHLLVNGALVLASRDVPKVLGVLLIIAFAGYAVDSAARLVMEEPSAMIARLVTVPNTIGELALMIWLALRGARHRD